MHTKDFSSFNTNAHFRPPKIQLVLEVVVRKVRYKVRTYVAVFDSISTHILFHSDTTATSAIYVHQTILNTK